MCLLADRWISALSEAGCSASVLLLVRHPQEVADSLAARDGMAPACAHLLWARHVLAAERSSRGLPPLVLTYDQLQEVPARALARVRALPGGPGLGAVPDVGDVHLKTARDHRTWGGSMRPQLEARVEVPL